MKPQVHQFYNEYRTANSKDDLVDTVQVVRVYHGTARTLGRYPVWMCQVKDSNGAVRTAWLDGNDVVKKGEQDENGN